MVDVFRWIMDISFTSDATVRKSSITPWFVLSFHLLVSVYNDSMFFLNYYRNNYLPSYSIALSERLMSLVERRGGSVRCFRLSVVMSVRASSSPSFSFQTASCKIRPGMMWLILKEDPVTPVMYELYPKHVNNSAGNEDWFWFLLCFWKTSLEIFRGVSVSLVFSAWSSFIICQVLVFQSYVLSHQNFFQT